MKCMAERKAEAVFAAALAKIKPSVSLEDLDRFRDWERSFGG